MVNQSKQKAPSEEMVNGKPPLRGLPLPSPSPGKRKHGLPAGVVKVRVPTSEGRP